MSYFHFSTKEKEDPERLHKKNIFFFARTFKTSTISLILFCSKLELNNLHGITFIRFPVIADIVERIKILRVS